MTPGCCESSYFCSQYQRKKKDQSCIVLGDIGTVIAGMQWRSVNCFMIYCNSVKVSKAKTSSLSSGMQSRSQSLDFLLVVYLHNWEMLNNPLLTKLQRYGDICFILPILKNISEICRSCSCPAWSHSSWIQVSRAQIDLYHNPAKDLFFLPGQRISCP